MSLRIWLITLVPVMLYIVVIGELCARRVSMGWGNLLDLGIFDQVAWNTAHGRLYWDTIDPVARHSFLGQHVSPTLLVTGILYFLVPVGGPLRLVWLQTVCCAVAALPLAWIAGRRLGPAAAPWAATAYLLFPALQYANLFDFHEIVLAVPALGLACAFLEARRWNLLVVSLGFAMLCKEDMTLVVACFGLYLLISERGWGRWVGLILLVVAAAWALLVLKAIVPYYRGSSYVFGQRYAGGLLGPGGIGGIRLSYLWSWWTPGKGRYLLALLGPWLVLPLLAGRRSLLCLAPLVTSLLSTFPDQYDYHNQYAAPYAPLGMACAIWGIDTVRVRLRTITARIEKITFSAPHRQNTYMGRNRVHIVVALIALTTAISAWLIGPLPGARGFVAATYQQSDVFAEARPLLSLISPDASVSTVNHFGAYLTERPWLWHFPRGMDKAQYILVTTRIWDAASWDYRPDALASLRTDPHYRLLGHNGRVFLFIATSP